MVPADLALADSEIRTLNADAVIVGTVSGPSGLTLAAGSELADVVFDGMLCDLLRSVGATGAAGEIVKLPSRGALASPVVIATGLGEPAVDGSPMPEQVHRASGVAARALTGSRRAVTTLCRVTTWSNALTCSLAASTGTGVISGRVFSASVLDHSPAVRLAVRTRAW